MSVALSKIATEVARRWIAARERRAKRGLNTPAPRLDDVREFAAVYCDELDAFQLDTVVDLAISKINNFDLRQSVTS